MPSWMQFDTPGFMKSAPAATTMQFESEPAGAEAKTSLGQTCRTPCTLAVTASEFSVSFTLPGYQPQTVPVRVVASTDGDPDATPAPRAEPGVCRIAAGRARRRWPRSPPRRRKSRSAAPRPAPTAMAPEHALLARPRAGLALAARRAETGSIPPKCDMRPPTGGRIRFGFLDMARTGSLKRGRSGA